MTDKRLNEIARRRSTDDIPALIECVRELRSVLSQCMREAGHAEDCALLEGQRCDCWMKQAAKADCVPRGSRH
jgi:hypothetical protein